MTVIAYAVDLALIINGSIQIKPYREDLMPTLNSVHLWDHMGINEHHKIKFGCQQWRSPANKATLTFYDCTPKLAYQLKALALGMYTQGIGEGMSTLAWNSICHIISNLKRFGIWIAKYGLSGLDELDHLDELKIRHIIREMVVDMKMHEHPSVATALLKAMYWILAYQLISNPCIYQLMNEYLSPFVLLKKSRRNKHSIIPPRILKKLLVESELQVEKAQQMFEPWSAIQSRLNHSISTLSSAHFNDGTYIDALNNDEQNELAKYHQTINKLRRYVFILVLSYTGMRYGEAIALPDDAAVEREGEYYLKTLLSKTTDGTQCLEWITNKTTYDAVVLLSKINQIYRERAKLLLEYHSDALPCKRRINMHFGLLNRELFNVQQHKQSCQFTSNSKSNAKGFTNINTLFSIPVTAEDIEVMNRMTCNYQSVTHNHKGFRRPYQEGILFNFSAHQFRHTFAWFIVANRLGDLDDIKYQFKHLENCMALVYSQRGYESMEELINLTESFSEFLVSQALADMVQAAEDGTLAGRGGQSFMTRLSEILADDLSTGNAPQFSSMQELLSFTAKHTSNFRGLSHGYCTKGSDCKVRNAADPSHCIYCDSYIATPKHLHHWTAIKQRCEAQLQAFEKFPGEMKQRFLSFSTALNDNLNAANTIINQLTIKVKEA